jgi:hypothetical protein
LLALSHYWLVRSGDTLTIPFVAGGLEARRCQRDMRIADLKPGWDVVTNDGHRIGTIREVGQQYVEVSGGYFSAAIYVPASAIANVENQTVHLNLARAEADVMGWQQRPRSSDELRIGSERDVDREI